MGKITLAQAAAWCGGSIDPKYKDVEFLGASNDTRTIKEGQLFLALKGARDGHDFIPQALEKGAAAVLCEHCDGDFPAIVVADTRIALGQIARGERRRIGMKVVGITGSVGKSTTKEMVATVLETTYRIAKTPANHNNDIGLPMTILSIPEDTQIAVLEMGMNHFGEISYLASIARPDVAVITNIGTMHIEHLGSRQGILQAKLEILEGMPSDGRVILNGDDTLLWNVHHQTLFRAIYFGMQNPECDYLASNIVQGHSRLCFEVRYGDLQFPVEMGLEGVHYVSDAMAAISVGMELGVEPTAIRLALTLFENMAGRQEIVQKRGMTIIRDCYNAGPESMAAALVVLGGRPGRRVAVLGDMLELGICAPAEHYRAGRIAAENAELVLAYGPNSNRVVSGAITGGMDTAKVKNFTDPDELVAAMKRMLKPGDVVLVKGSHGMHMDQILDQFLKET